MKLYNEETIGHTDLNMFGNCEESLNKLAEARIFDIASNDNGESFFIVEMCDEYFTEKLTKEMCNDLSDLFSKLAKHLK